MPFCILCANVDLPDGAVQLLSNTGDFVTFQISQVWNIDGIIPMISVDYHELIGETDCNKNTNVGASQCQDSTDGPMCGGMGQSIPFRLCRR
jgi:hypothetical protein